MTNTKSLQEMSMPELKQELTNHYDSNAGEILFSLIEMRLTRQGIRKSIIRMIERKLNA